MKVSGKTVVVTGGANGIGRALCERFMRDGARMVVVADLDESGAQAVARSIGGTACRCDVSNESGLVDLVEETERRFGPIELFCSNAGVALFDPEPGFVGSASNEAWARSWAVNVMAHVYAARAVVPLMAARGGGYLLNTISAAGLLSQIGGAAYATTKHAALGFAESVAITHRDQGIRVSVLCPQGVDTPMLRSLPKGPQSADGVMTPEEVADFTVKGLDVERFLILPHPMVSDYLRHKAMDHDRWLAGMARLKAATLEG
jgi:NAD(P)-dependent dehydrogenase (short-subunit alcohol dehydrogenase family)